jgi:hypothetical protein
LQLTAIRFQRLRNRPGIWIQPTPGDALKAPAPLPRGIFRYTLR